MLASEDRAGAVRSVWSQTLVDQLRLTEDGLVLGAGSILVRLGKGTDAGRAAVEANADRLVALMSVAAGRPLTSDAVVPHVAAAAEHWRSGDKALAHLRLAVARLPHLACAADAWRLAIAEYLLDAGLPPAALVAELWPDAGGDLAKTYDPDEPRDWRGRWTDGAITSAPAAPDGPRPVRVATNGRPPGEDEKHFRERDISGLATPEEEIAHGRGADPFEGIPGIGLGPFAGRSVSVNAGVRVSPGQRSLIDAIGRTTGCHNCGSKSAGEGVGRFYCDHQPPTVACKPGEQQELFPHCQRCSGLQGWLLRQYRNKIAKERKNEMDRVAWWPSHLSG